MRSRHIPMTEEEYHLLPMHPGWKHEYWDGQAHFSPRHRFAVARMVVARRPVQTDYPLRPATVEDAPLLIPAYIEAFCDSFDYCDWERADIESAARRAIHDFFRGYRGPVLPASCVALDPAQHVVVGAALVVRERAGSPMLDLLFVRPAWQQHGLATALVSWALNALHQAGKPLLRSCYRLGNDQSVAWHRRFGFVEEPDLLLAQLYYRCAAHELWRREQLGALTPSERQRLTADAERWRTLMEELDSIAEAHGLEAAAPTLRL